MRFTRWHFPAPRGVAIGTSAHRTVVDTVENDYRYELEEGASGDDLEGLVSVVGDMKNMELTDKDAMGDVYEELLRKMAAAGANGQFRTPKHIVDMIVELMQPTLKDRIVDPAMGSAGFLVSAAQGVWSFRQLERMYRASTFERKQITEKRNQEENTTPRLHVRGCTPRRGPPGALPAFARTSARRLREGNCLESE